MIPGLKNGFISTAAAILASLLIVSIGVCGEQLAVIELKHRPADDIIPVITPFLGPGDTLSGKDFLLFVGTTPDNLARIQSIVSHLDQAARQLAITVVQGENALESLGSLAVSGRVSVGEQVTVGVGDHRGKPDDTLAVDARSRQRRRSSSDIQRVIAQEGQAATIFVGLSEPVSTGSPRHHGMRVGQIRGYREMLTGVRVTPRVSGDRMTLEIETRRDGPGDGGSGTVRTQGIQTRIQGRLDEWIEIGGILTAKDRTGTGLGERQTARQSSRRHVFVRVEAVPQPD
ncbi:hypothetical protein DSCA_22640 [Desulfosarcina alkanivorans]|uniref:Type II/III secretion system secretin-like domain-containing protein n=1 Tax=Desulfosarcina alkanivorans TaxID=571177 RepID=A0A5K7YPW4_9BACT|nr:type II and III secretion system protein [Desulfosarcina alkanivorans]BBO68334.1 hypothetical protein DSCA_22640 [Desulfosarcina alkanivorans]